MKGGYRDYAYRNSYKFCFSFFFNMDVAIMYSGGKDSTYALDYALQKGWNIKYLLSVKPNRDDCYLFHFATVEHTKEIAKSLGFKHIYKTCKVADAKKEAEIIRKVVEKNKVDALILGGVGLQETQINSIRDSLKDLNVRVFASHEGMEHGELMKEMIKKGYDIRLTQFAAEGLNIDWLGRKIDEEAFVELEKLSKRFGFHIGAEGGHWDSLVLDGPIFKNKFETAESEKVITGEFNGYLLIKQLKEIKKEPIVVTI